MQLTGKCKEAFDYWFIRQDNVNNVEHRMLNDNQLSEIATNAHIISFFDTVEINILLDTSCGKFYYVIKDLSSQEIDTYLNKYIQEEEECDERKLAYNFAILKANEIYNSRKK